MQPLAAYLLRAIQAIDRQRLQRLQATHPGVEIDPTASTNLAVAHYELGPGARLRIGRGVVTERTPGALRFVLGAGASIEIGEGTWLRTELGPNHLRAFDGARITLGPGSWLNGCHLSAKRAILCGRRAWIGPGARLIDADQHALDSLHPERMAPITLGDHVWITSDVTVLRGVSIGDHCVIGARSVVTHDIPPHTMAHGIPARPQGPVGDRSETT
ncbi:MAG TPA: acyltransferase [Myxococcota bacterium]|nr:acyltransferase [Myxococcota bacterium]